MAPRHQHTFTLVPNPLGMQGLMSRPPAANAPQSRPPMTSKQAQKLYREANRVPRVSKAEQRRLDREEQDRIRRELDKEKAANKARILREKKKAKEQQALDEKKRKGLPLVTVRPSQDTIARFVRGNGAGKKRDAEGVKVAAPILEEKAEDNPSTTTDDAIAPEKTVSQREVKRRRLSQRSSQTGKDFNKGADMAAKVDDGGRRNDEVAAQEPKDRNGDTANPGKTVNVAEAKESRTAPPGSEDHSAPTVGVAHETIPDGSTRDKNSRDKGERAEQKPRHGSESRQAGKPAACAKVQPARPPGNIVQAKPTQLKIDEPSTKSTPPNPMNIPQRHETPAQSARKQENIPVVVPKPPPCEPDRCPTPNKTPANTRPAQKPNPHPLSPKSKPMPPPQQRRPSPNAPPAQQPPPRKPLQEATNSLNRDRPPAAKGGPLKFASPYRPPLHPTRRHPSAPAPAPTPSFKQSRPETPAAREKPQFLRPHPRPAPLHQPLESAGRQKPGNTSSGFTSAPPTSTQLFIMAHLDDLCPSPSQEARELQGDEPSAVVAPPKPAPKPAAMPPPPIRGSARKPASGTSRFMQQASKVSTPMPPPPRPKPVEPAAVTPAAMPDMPFFSTQDLLFSSQDLRDLDEPMTTTCKMGGSGARGHPPPFKPRQGPSPLGQYGKPAQQPAQRFCPKQPAASKKALPRADAPPRQETPKPRAFLRQATPTSPWLGTSQPSQPTPCPGPVVGQKRADTARKAGTAREDAPRAPSPEKLRFFGSSGGGIDLLRAVCESRKSHQEEERRRQAEQTEQAAQQRHQDRRNPENRRNKGPTARDPGTCNQQGPTLTANRNANLPSQKQDEPAGDGPVTNSHVASQETDYGDVELDSIDFDELGLGVVQPPAIPEPKGGLGREDKTGIQDGGPELYSFDELDDCMLDDDDGPWI